MMLDSSTIIWIAIVLILMLVPALWMLFLTKTRRSRKVAEVEQLIKQLGGKKALKKRLLDAILVEKRSVDQKAVGAIQQQVEAAELALLQRVVQLFLQRDEALLEEIKQLVGNVSAVYCRLLVDLGYVQEDEGPSEVEIDNAIAKLDGANRLLVSRLETAMQTIAEITAAYTREFGNSQSTLESVNDAKTTIFSDKIRKARISPEDLENSSKRMIQLYLDSAQRIMNSIVLLERGDEEAPAAAGDDQAIAGDADIADSSSGDRLA